ncbi:MAG: Asp23/Gls24 family envelope stress response protein [Lapillicoccus sp.]
MADAPTVVPAPGRLVIRDRVVEQIARRSARDVAGVATAQTGTWGSLTRQQTPRVDVTRVGDRVRLVVHVAVTWPESLTLVAAQVRSTVTDRVREGTDLVVERVDVRVDAAPDLSAESADGQPNVPRRRVL